MAATVEVVIEGRDNTQGMFGGIGNSFSNLGNIVTGIKSAFDLLAGAFEGIVNFGSQFTDSFIESENAVAKLEAVIIATGGAAGMTSQELQNFATEMQNLTVYTDEQILSSQAMLLTFRNIGEDVFPLASQAVLDMSTLFGGLDASAVQLGKALNDPIAGISALQRVGITFTEQQKEMIKNFVELGDVESAQLLILKEIEMQVGGTALAMGQTFGGQIEILKNRFDGLREGIGGLIAQALTPLLEFLGPDTAFGQGMDIISETLAKLTDYLDKGMPLFQSLGIIFMNLSHDADLAGIAGNLQAIGGALLEMQDVLNSGGSMWDAMIVGIGNFSQSLAQSLVDFRSIFENDGFIGLIEELDVILGDAIANIDWQALGDRFGVFIGELFSGAGSWTLPTEALSAIGNAISDFMIGAMGYISWNQLGQALSDSLTNYFLNFFRVEGITDAWEEIGFDITEGLARGITFENMRDNISTFVSNVVNYFKQLLGIASPSTVFFGIGRDIIAGLMGGFTAMINPLIALIDYVVSAILAPFAPIFDLLGIDIGSTGSLGSHTTGTTTGGTGTTTGSTTGSGTVVNQYFSGATINVGSWDEIEYDCVYPNPFVAATSGQLGGSGGGTGAPR